MSNVAYAHLSQLLPDSGALVQLLPLGEFAAADGRPGNMPGVSCAKWFLTKERAQHIADTLAARKNKLLFDYEHAAMLAKTSGQPAPAAGWGDRFVVEDDGLYAQVAWTPKARLMIADKEYRYTSPVFGFDPQTGAVLNVQMCAITNDPALDGMTELQVALSRLNNPFDSSRQQGNDTMDALLTQLRWLLNLPKTALEPVVLTSLSALRKALDPNDQAVAGFDLPAHLAMLTAQGAQVAALTARIASLTTQTEPDPAQYVAVAALTAAQHTIAELSDKLHGGTVVAMVAAARQEGRLLGEADAQWARNFAARHGAAELQAALAARQPIPALQGTQTDGKRPLTTMRAVLTADQREAARLMGHSEAEYAAMLTPASVI